MNTRWSLITLVVMAAVVLTGCDSAIAGAPSAHPDGRPSDTSSTSTGPNSTEPDSTAPPVANPKNVRGTDPCTLLTPQQLSELTFTEPGVKDASPWGEDGCVWQNGNLTVGVTPDTGRSGLAEIYRRKDNFDTFAASDVDGYPVVRVNESLEASSCVAIVGVADDQLVHVHFGRVAGKDPAYRDPCAFAETIVGMVLGNLPAA